MVEKITRIPKLPKRRRDAHKGDFGTVLVVAGSRGMLGAAILCARGALRGGAGLVRACLPPSLMAAFTAACPSATTAPRTGAVRGWMRGADVVVMGPGLSAVPASKQLVRSVLQHAVQPMVLDADALNVLAPLRRPLTGRVPLVLTPHPGEAARLLATDKDEVQADRTGAALELARRSGHVVVLKGARTVVTDGERLFVNRTGNPGMATGGSGDVLAGLLGALLGQDLAPFDAACLGVHVHGKAGDLVAKRLSEPGLIAEDLPVAIAEVLSA